MNYYTRQGMKGMASKKSVPCRILNKESAIETQKSREDMMFNLNRFASGGRSKEAPPAFAEGYAMSISGQASASALKISW